MIVKESKQLSSLWIWMIWPELWLYVSDNLNLTFQINSSWIQNWPWCVRVVPFSNLIATSSFVKCNRSKHLGFSAFSNKDQIMFAMTITANKAVWITGLTHEGEWRLCTDNKLLTISCKPSSCACQSNTECASTYEWLCTIYTYTNAEMYTTASNHGLSKKQNVIIKELKKMISGPYFTWILFMFSIKYLQIKWHMNYQQCFQFCAILYVSNKYV